MLNAQDLSNAFARNTSIVKMQSEGLTNEDSMRQLPHGNCLNWVLGHIAIHRDSVLQLLGEPPFMGDTGARYKRDSEVCHSDRPWIVILSASEESRRSVRALLHWWFHQLPKRYHPCRDGYCEDVAWGRLHRPGPFPASNSR